jgi:hypothetical protein
MLHVSSTTCDDEEKLNPLQTAICIAGLHNTKRMNPITTALANALAQKVPDQFDEVSENTKKKKPVVISVSLLSDACQGLYKLDRQEPSTFKLARAITAIMKYSSRKPSKFRYISSLFLALPQLDDQQKEENLRKDFVKALIPLFEKAKEFPCDRFDISNCCTGLLYLTDFHDDDEIERFKESVLQKIQVSIQEQFENWQKLGDVILLTRTFDHNVTSTIDQRERQKAYKKELLRKIKELETRPFSEFTLILSTIIRCWLGFQYYRPNDTVGKELIERTNSAIDKYLHNATPGELFDALLEFTAPNLKSFTASFPRKYHDDLQTMIHRLLDQISQLPQFSSDSQVQQRTRMIQDIRSQLSK